MNMVRGTCLFAVLLLMASPVLAAFNPGTFAAPLGSTVNFPTLPYVTPEMYGAVGNGSTDDHVALNAATAAACAHGLILFLDKSYYIGSTTWNMTGGSGGAGCNAGITVQGINSELSVITYKASSNNTGIAWDITGAARVDASGFSVNGGSPAGNNSPLAVMLMGKVQNGISIIFSGTMHFVDVNWTNYQGTWAFVDNGAEQLDFLNCAVYVDGASSDGIEFVASGSAPQITSAIVTTITTVDSMTTVHWYGEQGVLSFSGTNGIIFHATTAGSVATIHFDGYAIINTSTGTFTFMSDDISSVGNTIIEDVGSYGLKLDSNLSNGEVVVAKFGAATVDKLEFNGETCTGVAVVDDPFTISAQTTIYNSQIVWNASACGGSWGASLVFQANTGSVVNGLIVRDPLPLASLLGGGGTLNSYWLQGSDGTTGDQFKNAASCSGSPTSSFVTNASGVVTHC